MNRKPVIGLALGSGSARGWAHIGVIRALEQAGISPTWCAAPPLAPWWAQPMRWVSWTASSNGRWA